VCAIRRYVAKIAGDLELHIWAVPEGKDERLPLPGSPFSIHCAAGKAHAGESSVDGFTRIHEVVDSRGSSMKLGQQQPARAQPRRHSSREATCGYEESNEVFAGDLISVRPKIRDKLGNPTAAPEGELKVRLAQPDGSDLELKPNVTIRSGLTNYDVRYEPQVRASRLTTHAHLRCMACTLLTDDRCTVCAALCVLRAAAQGGV
jgi:hypothetical protein